MTCKRSSPLLPRRRLTIIVAFALFVLMGSAVADDAPLVLLETPVQAAPSSQVVAPSTHATIDSQERPNYLFNWQSIGKSAGESMADHGIYLHGFYQQAYMNVTGGGNSQRSNWLGLGYFGFDIDTEKAFGLKGGMFDFTLSTQSGTTLNAGRSTGSQTLVPWGFGDEVRLVDFYYDQSLFNGTVHFTAGRMNQLSNLPGLSPGFHVMPWLCTFWSNSCGTPHAYNFNASHPGYQVGTWGGVVTVHPAPYWYAKVGVIENEPSEQVLSIHNGWPGRDWALDAADGAFIPVQVGYLTTLASSLYPTNFHIGGYYDTAPYADKFFNDEGEPILTHPGKPDMHDKATGIFTGITQTVWRFSDDPHSARGMALFASGDWDATGYSDDREQIEGGFLISGPFASRSADSLNFLVSFQEFDSRLKAARELLAAEHGISYTMKDQTGVELNYGIALSPGFVFYPYVQYVLHPDQLQLAVPNPRDTHATVVGFRMTFRFDAMVGFPQPGT
jgi:porin